MTGRAFRVRKGMLAKLWLRIQVMLVALTICSRKFCVDVLSIPIASAASFRAGAGICFLQNRACRGPALRYPKSSATPDFSATSELVPSYAETHHWAALNYMMTGQHAAAEAELRQAQVLDPLSLMITEGLAENFFYSRRYDDAIGTSLKIPDRSIGWSVLAQAYLLKGMYEESLRAVPDMVGPKDPNRLRLRAEVLALSGDRAGALKILGKLERDQPNSSGSGFISPAGLGMSCAVIGERERAFAWLEKAYQQPDPALAQLKVDPSLDKLRSDPRYLELLKKLGLSD